MDKETEKFLQDVEKRTAVMAKALREKPSKKVLDSMADWLDIMGSQARNLQEHGTVCVPDAGEAGSVFCALKK